MNFKLFSKAKPKPLCTWCGKPSDDGKHSFTTVLTSHGPIEIEGCPYYDEDFWGAFMAISKPTWEWNP